MRGRGPGAGATIRWHGRWRGRGPPECFIASGTLTYDAATALPDGSYDWDSFIALTLFFDLPTLPTTFDQFDLTTSSSQVNIVLLGSGFYFTNDTAGGGGDGALLGSADFVNGAYGLSFEPYEDGAGSPPFFGGPTTPGYMLQENGGGTVLMGNYGVVPEPSAAMLLLVGGGLCFRRRR